MWLSPNKKIGINSIYEMVNTFTVIGKPDMRGFYLNSHTHTHTFYHAQNT
jgi:hypothetical protein